MTTQKIFFNPLLALQIFEKIIVESYLQFLIIIN